MDLYDILYQNQVLMEFVFFAISLFKTHPK